MATHTSEVIMKFVDQFSSGFDKTMKRIQSGTLVSKRTINDLNRAGTQMLSVGTMMFVPLAAGIKSCVDAEMQYENALAKVRTIADESEKSIGDIGNEMREISKTYGEDVSAVADTFYNVISATVDTKNAIDYVRVASDMAVGGFAEMDTAVGGLTASMASYKKMGYDMYRIGDLLAQTQVYGKTTINELSLSLGTVLPFASNVGMSFEDLSTAMAVLTSNGLDTAMATTAFKNAISSILNPSSQATKAFEKMGVAYGSAAFSKMDFTTYLENLRDAVGLSDEAKKKLEELMATEGTTDDDLTEFFKNAGVNIDNLLMLFGNIRGATAMLSLVGNVEKFKNFREQMNEENSTGTLKKQAEIMLSSPERRMNVLKQNFNDALRQFGVKLMPKVNELLEKATDALNKLNSMSDEQISQIVDNVITVAKASAGLMILGSIAKAVASILTLSNTIWKPLAKVLAIKIGAGAATTAATGAATTAATAGASAAGAATAAGATGATTIGGLALTAAPYVIGGVAMWKATDYAIEHGAIKEMEDPSKYIPEGVEDKHVRIANSSEIKRENNVTNNSSNTSNITNNNSTTNISISNVNVDGAENFDDIIKEVEKAADSMR